MSDHNTLPPDDSNRIDLETLVDALAPENKIGQPRDYYPSKGRVLEDDVDGTMYLGDGEQWLPVGTDTGLATPAFDTDHIDTERLRYDYADKFPHYPFQPNIDNPLTAVRPYPNVSNPVLTPSDVDDHSDVNSVADPFLVDNTREDGLYYMFFESLSSNNIISYAYSNDGLDWTYGERIIDDDPDHAYPYVVKHNGTWYLSPTNGSETWRIYTADSISTSMGKSDWTLAEEPLSFVKMGEPTWFRWPHGLNIDESDKRWWFFQYDDNDDLVGYYSDKTAGGPTGLSWTEHPSNPLQASANGGRPRGRPMVYENYVDFFRFPNVSLYRITDLTTDSFNMTQVKESLFNLTGDSYLSFARTNMHHIDWLKPRTGGKELLAIDGIDGSETTIGMFTRSDIDPSHTKAHLSTDQTLTSSIGETTVEFDTVDHQLYDIHWDTSNYVYTPPSRGYYRVNVQLRFDTTNPPFDVIIIAQRREGGSRTSFTHRATVEGSFASAPLASFRVPMKKPDNLNIRVEQLSSDSQDIMADQNSCFVEIHREW